MKILIRNAREEDIFGICKIENKAFSDPWSEASLLSAVRDPLTRFVLAFAEDSDAPAGYGIIQIFMDEGEILSVAVDNSFRRRGIGREIMNHLLSVAQSEGVENVFLEVRESNTAARNLYSSLGFVPMWRRRNYYRKPTEDAVTMRASLENNSNSHMDQTEV